MTNMPKVISIYRQNYLNRLLSRKGELLTARVQLSDAQRAELALLDEQIKVVLENLRKKRAQAKSKLTKAKRLLKQLEVGLAGVKRIKFPNTDISGENYEEGGGTGIIYTGPRGLTGVTHGMVKAQRLEVAAAQKKYGDAAAAFTETSQRLKAEARGRKQLLAAEATADKFAPSLAEYTKGIPRQAARTQSRDGSPAGHYWNRYTALLVKAEAKSAESAGYHFLKAYFRYLSGTVVPGNYALRNYAPDAPNLTKYLNVQQADLDTLYGMVKRGIAAGKDGRTPEDKRSAREEIENFITATFGVPAADVAKYK